MIYCWHCWLTCKWLTCKWTSLAASRNNHKLWTPFETDKSLVNWTERSTTMHLIAEHLLSVPLPPLPHHTIYFPRLNLVVCQVVLVPPGEAVWSSVGPLPVQTPHSLYHHLPLGYHHELRGTQTIYGWHTLYWTTVSSHLVPTCTPLVSWRLPYQSISSPYSRGTLQSKFIKSRTQGLLTIF